MHGTSSEIQTRRRLSDAEGCVPMRAGRAQRKHSVEEAGRISGEAQGRIENISEHLLCALQALSP